MPTLPEVTDKPSVREYQVVRLSKNNIADMARLHNAVYGTTVAENYFEKKYDTAYTGVENVGFIAYNADNLPIAFYGVIPCFIQHKNKIILVAQSADTMTHPQYRYKGMFVELSNITFDLCKELSILLVFGFPNQNSYHGAVTKLGWQMADTMACFNIDIKSFPLESLCNKIVILKKMYQAYCRFILKKFLLDVDGISNSVLKDDWAGIYRSNNYLQYKTYSSTKVISLANANIWASNKHGIMIGDMENVNEENFTLVIDKLRKLARKMGIKNIQFHCSTNISLYKLFLAQFKSTPSYPVLFQDFGSAISPEKIKFTFADIDIF